jgi:hypothetical protein
MLLFAFAISVKTRIQREKPFAAACCAWFLGLNKITVYRKQFIHHI